MAHFRRLSPRRNAAARTDPVASYEMVFAQSMKRRTHASISTSFFQRDCTSLCRTYPPQYIPPFAFTAECRLTAASREPSGPERSRTLRPSGGTLSTSHRSPTRLMTLAQSINCSAQLHGSARDCVQASSFRAKVDIYKMHVQYYNLLIFGNVSEINIPVHLLTLRVS